MPAVARWVVLGAYVLWALTETVPPAWRLYIGLPNEPLHNIWMWAAIVANGICSSTGQYKRAPYLFPLIFAVESGIQFAIRLSRSGFDPLAGLTLFNAALLSFLTFLFWQRGWTPRGSRRDN